MPRIDNWSLAQRGDGLALMGSITGHNNPNVGLGPVSLTSIIVGRRSGKVVTESGTEYTLGMPDETYEEKVPNAHNQLYHSLEEV